MVINYRHTRVDCPSTEKQVDETGLGRIIQMNCSCLQTDDGWEDVMQRKGLIIIFPANIFMCTELIPSSIEAS